METVYIVGIVAGAAVLVLVFTVWQLRDRLKIGELRGSLKKQEFEARLQATPQPQTVAKTATTDSEARAAQRPPSVDVSGNWMIGRNTIQVLRNGVRANWNRLMGTTRIEIKPEPPVSPTPEARRSSAGESKKQDAPPTR